MMQVKQFIPQEICLECDGCCRFSEKDTPWTPYKREVVSCNDYFICSSFEASMRKCRNYEARFLDCRIYPFILHGQGGKVYLAVDLNCLYASQKINTEEFRGYASYLNDFLNGDEAKKFLRDNSGLICRYNEELKIVSEINLNGEILGSHIKIEDKPLFEKYLKIRGHEISAYSFANIYSWRSLFDIRYKIIGDCLCVFFQDKAGCFMYLPPLGKRIDKELLNECFRIMDARNTNRAISRIENIEESILDPCQNNGFVIIPKEKEYVYLRDDLAGLCGDKFKAKRANCNYFVKNYKYSCQVLTPGYTFECLSVLAEWRKERLHKEGQRIDAGDKEFYHAILDDNCLAQEEALLNLSRLGLLGKVIRIGAEIKAYTFGFELNDDTFCIMAETADLKFKGIAQFLFREFCLDLKKYKYINVMDDSGLENIRKVKLSYRPERKISAYILEKAYGKII
ncbi:MAG: phosphatidylglycerol lysyltransferase domain-containing protein [Candidatus Omnitrophota bacterium]|nr:phosphatidylglycerol lysyltransferase domain-containing protein [Candidatus Omnitrophota bacterium]